ncbi:hypothetical protein ABB02_02027 [Clostridiaceae bacterium JG1575]|nr:hypothetical protein ABB02_02027 [Clostridiaceae bacterium JG1575]
MIILQASANKPLDMLLALLPFLAMMGVLYFFLMRPEKKRKEAYREMLGQLSVNDEILTKGGIVGKIIKLDDEYMVVESGPERVRLKMVRDAIYTKVKKDEPTQPMQ